MPLSHVPPAELPRVWALVEGGLKQIIRRCKGTPWTPDIVKSHLVNNSALLFACEDGFYIAERCEELHTRAAYLNVWCMYFRPGKAAGLKRDLLQSIRRLQAELLCNFIQLSSPRIGWVRALEDDFDVHLYVLRSKQ